MLNPNGLNSSREISIAEGQTEAVILLNAAGNAQVKEHKIAVRGEGLGMGIAIETADEAAFREKGVCDGAANSLGSTKDHHLLPFEIQLHGKSKYQASTFVTTRRSSTPVKR